MPSRARLASLGLTEWYELGNSVVVTNDIADANVTGAKLKDVFTANIIESGNTTTGNVYFSNTRSIGALKAGNGIIIQANGLIQTDLSNSDVLVLIGTSVLSNLVNATNVIALANLYAPGDVTLGNVNITGSFDVTLSTSNVSEGSNLYFTNARAVGSLTAGDGVTIEANGLISSPSIFSGNTDAVPEGTANLYFTNTRAIGSLTAGENIVIEANGMIVGNADPVFDSLYVGGNLTVAGNLTYLNVESLQVDDNMIYLNANSTTANPDLGWAGNYNDGTYAHAGVFRDATDGVFKFFDGYTPEPDSSPFIDTSNASFNLANVQATTFIGNLQGSIIGFSTDDVTEGSNLYFTNVRAVGSLTAGDGIVIEANGLVVATANTTSINANTASLIDLSVSNVLTANRIEANSINAIDGIFVDNLYVQGNLDANISTALVWESGNLYFTNDRAIASFTAGDNITIESNGLIVGQPGYTDGEAFANLLLWFANIDTDDIPEGTANLYFTNDRAIAAVQDNLSTSNVYEGANLYFTNDRAIAAVQDNLTTSNVGEGSNLYFTNVRAVGSLTAGDGIVIESNGLVTSYATGVAVILSSETFEGDGSNTNFTMGASVSTPESIFVLVNGVTQIPGVDYSVSNVTLQFTMAPVDSSNIEVRFIGNGEAVIDSRGYFSKSIDEASGYAVTSTTGTALTVPLNTRIILHSIYVTNIDDSLTGNVAVTASVDQYNSGSPDPNTNVYIANVLPIDHRMSVELLKKPQVLNAGDKISMRAFKDGVGADANLHAYLTYESRSDVGYFGSGINLGDTNDHILFAANGTAATVENVRLANYGGTPAAATVRWTNSSNVTQAYFCYNFVVPQNTTVELLENPKLVTSGGRILVSASAPNAIAVSVSGRRH